MRATRVTLALKHPVRGGYGLRGHLSYRSIGGHAQSPGGNESASSSESISTLGQLSIPRTIDTLYGEGLPTD